MAKDPAVLFYTSDFLSGTITMPDDERGRYIMLLCLQHQQIDSKLSEAQFNAIAKESDSQLREKFKTEGGKVFNERMLFEADKRKKYSESRRNNRKKKTKETYDKDMSIHMENENEDINYNKGYVEKFEAFWSVYPKKKSKEAAKKAFKRLYNRLPEDLIAIVQRWAKTEDWNKDGGQYIPYPGTWLNAGGWEDELPGNSTQTTRRELSFSDMVFKGELCKKHNRTLVDGKCPLCEEEA